MTSTHSDSDDFRDLRVRRTYSPTPSFAMSIPPPEKFVKKNISSFLQEYEMYMNAFGRREDEQLATMIIYHLDRKVREEVRVRKEYKDKDWAGIQQFLMGRYKWFDESIEQADLEELVRKKSYDDLHSYLGDFEHLASQLEGDDGLTPKHKIRMFLEGLNDKDLDDLLPALEDPETGKLGSDWGQVEKAVGRLVLRRKQKGTLKGGVTAKKVKTPISDTIPIREPALRKPNKPSEEEMNELAKRFSEFSVQFQDAMRANQQSSEQVERGGQQRRFTTRCLYCDATDHAKRGCALLSEHVRAHIVELNTRGRVCDPENHAEYPPNTGRGGIVKLVEEKEGKRNDGHQIASAYAIEIVPKPTERKKQWTVEEYKNAADEIRQMTGWKNLVAVETIEAHLMAKEKEKGDGIEVSVEEKRKATDDGSREPGSSCRLRSDSKLPAETSKNSTIPKIQPTRGDTQQMPTTEDVMMEEVRQILTPKSKRDASNVEKRVEEVKQLEKSPVTMEKDTAPRRQRRSEVEMTVDLDNLVERAILDSNMTFTFREVLAISNSTVQKIFRDKMTRRLVASSNATEIASVNLVEYDGGVLPTGVSSCGGNDEDFQLDYYSRATAKIMIRIGGHVMKALLDAGSEINVMPLRTFEALNLALDKDIDWGIRGANSVHAQLLGVCHRVPIEVGGIVERANVFVIGKSEHDIILGKPWEAAVRASYFNMDNGACYLKMKSKNGLMENVLQVIDPNDPRNRLRVRETGKETLKNNGGEGF